MKRLIERMIKEVDAQEQTAIRLSRRPDLSPEEKIESWERVCRGRSRIEKIQQEKLFTSVRKWIDSEIERSLHQDDDQILWTLWNEPYFEPLSRGWSEDLSDQIENFLRGRIRDKKEDMWDEIAEDSEYY